MPVPFRLINRADPKLERVFLRAYDKQPASGRPSFTKQLAKCDELLRVHQNHEVAPEILELRTAVEMEAAVIASERATGAQIKAIARAASTFSRAIANGDRAVKEDFDFHFAIAVATHNSRFVGFLEFLGGLIIPRQSIRTFEGKIDLQKRYLETVEKEHQVIVDAITARSPRKARDAMRRHLLNGKERYKQLAIDAG